MNAGAPVPHHCKTFFLILILGATVISACAEDTPISKAVAAIQTESIKFCIYDVADLIDAVDFPLPKIAAPTTQSNAARKDSPLNHLTKNVLAILNAEKRSTFELNQHSFEIATTQSIHNKIENHLSNLRKERGTLIVFDTKFLSVDSVSLKSFVDKYLDTPGAIFKDESGLRDFKDVKVNSAPKLVVFNGQRSHFIIGTFDDRDTDEVSPLRGIALEVRPILSSDRRTITFDAKILMRDFEQTFQMSTKVSQVDGSTTFLILGGVPQHGQLQTHCVAIRTSVIEFETTVSAEQNEQPLDAHGDEKKQTALPDNLTNIPVKHRTELAQRPVAVAKTSHKVLKVAKKGNQLEPNILILDARESTSHTGPLTYSWKQVSGSDLRLGPDQLNKERFALRIYIAGDYRFSLTVKDDKNISEEATVDIRVIDE